MTAAALPQPVTDEQLGELPAWDLSDLYRAPESPDITADLKAAGAQAKAIEESYKGKLAGLSGAQMAVAVEQYENLQDSLGRLGSYAQLVYAGNMSDPEIGRFFQEIREQSTEITSHLLFFTLELNHLDEESLEEKFADRALARYRPWFRDLRATKPHQLSEEAERLFHEKGVTGRAAWNRLFDETMAALRFSFEGEEMTSAMILNRMTDQDPTVREGAAKVFGKVLGDNQRVFGLITNTLAKDKEIEDSWRGFTRPVSSRNLANLVEDEVVDALVTAVRQAYPDLSHRYYALKAKWLGQDQLAYWDRNAPLPDDDQALIPWADARRRVLGAYGAFSDEMARVGEAFFARGWIDAPVRPGKAPGAFAHPTVPSAHPYLLVNFQGRTRDLMTLAHELGHGVHQVLAGGQGLLMSETPLTLAETASVFGEMLVFQSVLSEESDPKRRRVLLASKVEDMLNTVVRQVAMYSFEEKVHGERRSGEILTERLGDIWLETQRESLGPAIRLEGDCRNFWAYIPHFIHAPFYVYAYAFGDCLVNALFSRYEEAQRAGTAEEFVGKYLDLLRAGGSKRHQDLLAPFQLSAADPDFWLKGLGLTSRFIDELESLE